MIQTDSRGDVSTNTLHMQYTPHPSRLMLLGTHRENRRKRKWVYFSPDAPPQTSFLPAKVGHTYQRAKDKVKDLL